MQWTSKDRVYLAALGQEPGKVGEAPLKIDKKPAGAAQDTQPASGVGTGTSSGTPAIKAEHVDYLYTSALGVHDLTFQVPNGVIFGLVGPSGSGKTTTVRLLCGMYHPTSGRLGVLGESPGHFSHAARENIGYMAQHLTLYPMLTVQENLNFFSSLYGLSYFKRGKRLKSLLQFVELYDARTRLASKLSGGMQRRLQLACALAHDPQLIFADEPTAGVDPLLRGKFWEHFRQLRDEGHTLFITTQYIGEIEHCDVVGIMRSGRLLYIDTPEGLRRRAFGGDIVRLAVDPSRTIEAVQLLNNDSAVTDAHRSFDQPGIVYVSTNDASSATANLIALLHERDIGVDQVDRYIPPFDDVFIELMKRAGAEDAKSITHLLSFFSKEVNEIIRQPRLVLSLILGPFLVLLLFGLSYNSGLPKFRVAIVVPSDALTPAQTEDLKRSASANFDLVSLDSDENAALQLLRSGGADLVEILPADIAANVAAGRQSTVEFRYSEVNPFDESWVKYLGAAQINEMNRTLLETAISQARLKSNVLTNLPPKTVVSPLAPNYQNLRGASLSFVNFYAPSVLALILQHIAVTLGALSIVRERERGTLEMFRIAPVSPFSIIVGKYLGYALFLVILAAVLVGLLILLGTPFLGSWSVFAGLILLLIVASLGIGFLISCLSNSDSTAVQLSMLMLLLSIFFSGFFLPLENFAPAMKILTYAVPLTHGILGLQEIMLKGTQPLLLNWVMLGVIAFVTFIIVQFAFRRQLHHL